MVDGHAIGGVVVTDPPKGWSATEELASAALLFLTGPDSLGHLVGLSGGHHRLDAEQQLKGVVLSLPVATAV